MDIERTETSTERHRSVCLRARGRDIAVRSRRGVASRWAQLRPQAAVEIAGKAYDLRYRWLLPVRFSLSVGRVAIAARGGVSTDEVTLTLTEGRSRRCECAVEHPRGGLVRPLHAVLVGRDGCSPDSQPLLFVNGERIEYEATLLEWRDTCSSLSGLRTLYRFEVVGLPLIASLRLDDRVTEAVAGFRLLLFQLLVDA